MRPFATRGSGKASPSPPSPPPPATTKPKTPPPALSTSPTKAATPTAGTGTAFSRFISKMEFKSPAFDFGRVGGKHPEERKSIVSMAGEQLIEIESSSSTATPHMTTKSWGIQHTAAYNHNSNKRGKKGRDTIIGITASGERVHEQEDEFGLSAVIQWSSPVKKPPTSSSSSLSSPALPAGREKEEEKGGVSAGSSPSLSVIGEGKDAQSVESRPERSDNNEEDDDDAEDEEEAEEEDKQEAAAAGNQGGGGLSAGFTHGQSLSFQVSFGPGPMGLVIADTKAGKGTFIESFLQIPNKNGLVPTAVELSGRVRVGDLITHIGGTDVQFSSAVVVRDLLEKKSRPVTVYFERYPQRYSFQV